MEDQSNSASPAPATLGERSLRAVWHPCTPLRPDAGKPPLAIARGEGPWLHDTGGQRYFDATSSWWVNLFGHANPEINAALREQLDTLEHVMLAGCTHAPAVELAERLSALTGGALGHAFYASDGASAVEIALKMSFHYWRNMGLGGKREFICLRHGYHGETVGALAVTDVAIFRDAYDPMLMSSHVVMSPDARQAAPGESAAQVAQRALDELEALLHARGGQIAALIIEPLVQCAAGMAMHDPLYLEGVRALCDRYRVHLIADEIAVGCGRTGTFFAWEQARGAGDAPGAPLPAHLWPDFL
ncbi:aminotransferase class III-fold pyridoxal phosphate-dependent enzyme, partial [Cupriavidus sp. SK-3]|uniref:aminotransferase class III-fold pyridoxal phosphate-dependent enzyme n=1 Tax=Cupriavidus sp. SK-3 TaxID=1470558 RepID=UPI0039C85D30